MSFDPVLADRVAALAAMDSAELADVLAGLPHVTDILSTAKVTRQLVAGALANPQLIRITIEMLSSQAVQLLMVSNAYDGVMTADQVMCETEPIGPIRRAEVIEELALRMLIDRSGGGLITRPGVRQFVAQPGQSLATMVEIGAINNDELGRMLRHLGVAKPPAKKTDRADRLLEILGKGDVLRAAVASMTPAAQEVFAFLLDAGADGATAEAVGIKRFELDLARYSSYDGRYDRTRLGPVAEAVLDLTSHGLIAFDPYHGRVWAWREVLQSMAGRIINHWPVAWTGKPVTFHEAPIRPPQSPSAMAVVLQRVTAEPLAGLKSGGVGVKTFREIAKRYGQSDVTIALMFELGDRLGLIEEHSELVGRGRSAGWQYRYAIASEPAIAFLDQDGFDQWLQIIMAWIDGPDDLNTGPLMTFLLRQVLADLVALAPDQAIAESDFGQWIELRHIVARHIDTSRWIAHLRALDLIEPVGPVALTPLARTLLTDPQSAAAMLPDLDDQFVVQADHTVMAPPTLDPMIRTRLESIATLVSDGGMRVYRLDVGRIAHALSADETGAGLVEFLTETSSVPLPDAVSRLILDAERQRGGLTITAAATVVTATDVLGLAAAVKVKAARLTMVAPTVAISDLTPAKVTAALRAKKLAPTVTGVTVALPSIKGAARAKPTPRRARVGAPLILHRGAIESIVKAAR